jgi:hypothetical protein
MPRIFFSNVFTPLGLRTKTMLSLLASLTTVDVNSTSSVPCGADDVDVTHTAVQRLKTSHYTFFFTNNIKGLCMYPHTRLTVKVFNGCAAARSFSEPKVPGLNAGHAERVQGPEGVP